jgi:hypothetical protein
MLPSEIISDRLYQVMTYSSLFCDIVFFKFAHCIELVQLCATVMMAETFSPSSCLIRARQEGTFA